MAKGLFPCNGFLAGFIPPVRAMYMPRNPGRDYVTQYTGDFVWTVGVTKSIPLTERLKMELDAEAFNVTNGPNFANPVATDSQIFNASGNLLSSAGELTSTSSTSRQLQFAMRILF